MQLFAVPSRGGGTICVPGSPRLRTDQESAMGDPSLGTPPSERPVDDRLDSWKEIAVYLNRDVTTVQRWEKREGMPVHRHLHERIGSVYASREELDAWTRSRNPQPAHENGNNVPTLPAVPLAPATSSSRTPWRSLLLL